MCLLILSVNNWLAHHVTQLYTKFGTRTFLREKGTGEDLGIVNIHGGGRADYQTTSEQN